MFLAETRHQCLTNYRCLQEWVYKSGQAIESVFTRGCGVGEADTAGGKDRTQRDAGSEGHRLSDRLHRESDAAGEIAAKRRQRIRRRIPIAQRRS